MKSENKQKLCKLYKYFSNFYMFVQNYRLAGSKKIRYLEFSYSHHEYFVFSSQQPELR